MRDAVSITLHHIFSQKYDHDNPLRSFQNTLVSDMFFKYKKGEIIFQQGNPIRYFYILIKGRTIIVNPFSGVNGNIHHTLVPLDIMGLPDYLDDSPFYTSDVIAATSCVCFRIPQNLFISLITSDPILCYSTLRIIGQITSSNLRRVETNVIFSPKDRLGYYLLLASQGNLPYICPYTREELADTLAINLRSLHRYLATMEKEGHLELTKGKIRIEKSHWQKLEEQYIHLVAR